MLNYEFFKFNMNDLFSPLPHSGWIHCLLYLVPILRCSCGSKKKKTHNTIIPECSAMTTWMGTKCTQTLKELMVLVKWSLHDSTARWWLVDKVTHSSRLRQPIKCWVMFLLVQNWPFVFSEILLSDLKALWLKNSTTWLAHILIKFGTWQLPDTGKILYWIIAFLE